MDDQSLSKNKEDEDDEEKSGSEIIAISLQEYRRKHREKYQKRLDEDIKRQETEEIENIEEIQQAVRKSQEAHLNNMRQIMQASEEEYHRQLTAQRYGSDYYLPLQEENSNEDTEVAAPMRTNYVEQLITPPNFPVFNMSSAISRLIHSNEDSDNESAAPSNFLSFLRSSFSFRNLLLIGIILGSSILFALLMIYNLK